MIVYRMNKVYCLPKFTNKLTSQIFEIDDTAPKIQKLTLFFEIIYKMNALCFEKEKNFHAKNDQFFLIFDLLLNQTVRKSYEMNFGHICP